MPSLEFRLSTFAMVAAVVRRMLKTRKTLRNIPPVLLNRIKKLIFVMFKDYYFLPMFTQLTFIFIFSSPIMAATRLNFCSLALSVWLVICIFNGEEFI